MDTDKTLRARIANETPESEPNDPTLEKLIEKGTEALETDEFAAALAKVDRFDRELRRRAGELTARENLM